MQENLIILGEVVVFQHGHFKKIKRYLKGKHPHLGKLQIGLSGSWETIQEVDVFLPLQKYFVID